MTEEQNVRPDAEDQDQVEELVQEAAPAAEVKAESQTEPRPKEEGDVQEGRAEAEELDALRQELEEARAKEAEYLDGWQRARAELSNARKRFQREQQRAYANAKSDLLIRFLPVIDDFERAFETLPKDLESDTWVEGVKLVQSKAQGLLEQEGVAPIDAAGQEFDPSLHQAVTHEPSEEVPEGHVIAEMQRGYTVGDRVLRPCMVRVSAGPPPEPEPAEESDTEEATDSAEEETASTVES
ncbi:MAG: nucleotide exchange factor GrpE [Anaerolineae bacterium]|nr:nucleotide exchange factor GrpE [Anaerolineae bacterium]